MMKKINIAELLKDCPSGMELDCTMCDEFVLVGVDNSLMFPIKVKRKDGCLFALTKYGQCCDSDYAKCVIFPKGKTTWEGFQRPFKDGDVVRYLDSIAIFKEWGDETLFRTHVTAYLHGDSTIDVTIPLFGKSIKREVRFATKEEKQKLFDAIKANGYKWNEETKTLEKLIEPEFKVGDRITLKNYNDGNVYKIIDIKDTYYVTEQGKLPFYYADSWKLVTNKFNINALKPFESRVLVRNDEGQYWIPAFWGCKRADGYTTTFGWCKYCIPFDGNEHLLETNKDCEEYFKTWK